MADQAPLMSQASFQTFLEVSDKDKLIQCQTDEIFHVDYDKDPLTNEYENKDSEFFLVICKYCYPYQCVT